jgi:1-acyl-sn-glycerol-3-phosphate acyltransferase
MGSYVVLSKLTNAGVKIVKGRPEVVEGLVADVAALEGKVVQQFALLGDYDFCTIVSLPDNAAAHLLAGGSPVGAERTILPAIDLPLFVRLLGQTTETEGPHRWQVQWWARLLRPFAYWWTTGREWRKYMQPYRVYGRRHLRGLRGSAIFIANHQSHMDMPALYYALPKRFRLRVAAGGAADRWFIKGRKGFANQPWFASLSGSFPITRGGGSAALDYPKWLIDKGESIVIFPEGTRSRSGKLGKFKHGPSILAVSKGVPVVPIWLEGTRHIRAVGSREMTPGPVTVLIGEPIRFAPDTDIATATRTLHRAVEELGRRVHGRLGTRPPASVPAVRSADQPAPAGD